MSRNYVKFKIDIGANVWVWISAKMIFNSVRNNDTIRIVYCHIKVGNV